MNAQLKERAQKVAQLRNASTRFTSAQITEIAEVHHLLTGRTVACTTCNVYGLLNEINSKLIQEPLIIKNMANAKGHFKSGAASTEIIRHGKNGTTVITPDNINEGDNFEWAAKHYPHLVDETKKKETEESAPAKTETKTTTTPAKK